MAVEKGTLLVCVLYKSCENKCDYEQQNWLRSAILFPPMIQISDLSGILCWDNAYTRWLMD